ACATNQWHRALWLPSEQSNLGGRGFWSPHRGPSRRPRPAGRSIDGPGEYGRSWQGFPVVATRLHPCFPVVPTGGTLPSPDATIQHNRPREQGKGGGGKIVHGASIHPRGQLSPSRTASCAFWSHALALSDVNVS